MARARTNTTEMHEDLLRDLRKVRDSLDLTDPAIEEAMAGLETFCAVAIRVFAKTNPSKIRSVAITTEIQVLWRPTP